jgi:hypothetical protein
MIFVRSATYLTRKKVTHEQLVRLETVDHLEAMYGCLKDLPQDPLVVLEAEHRAEVEADERWLCSAAPAMRPCEEPWSPGSLKSWCRAKGAVSRFRKP